MCQSLVQRIAQSRQLQAVADPAVLDLFENWLDELEEEVSAYLRAHPAADEAALARDLGLSGRGAAFLLAKLRVRDR